MENQLHKTIKTAHSKIKIAAADSVKTIFCARLLVCMLLAACVFFCVTLPRARRPSLSTPQRVQDNVRHSLCSGCHPGSKKRKDNTKKCSLFVHFFSLWIQNYRRLLLMHHLEAFLLPPPSASLSLSLAHGSTITSRSCLFASP